MPQDPEVHLFGPGYGEGVLVHLGRGDWIVVDSCMNGSTGKPAALEYLESRAIAPASSVKMVVATHWHDDHIRGLGAILRACPTAKFCCSDALLSEQVLTLVSVASSRSLMRSGSGVDEFAGIIAELRRRTRDSSQRLAGSGLVYARANRRLWCREVDGAEVWSLSPSDAEFEASLRALGALLPNPGKTPRTRTRVASIRPNTTAVVLWIQVPEAQILLGADLEEAGYDDSGWSAIVGSNERPASRASLVKVAHHGSETGHHPSVWTHMLTTDATAALTPFRRGAVSLPKPRDVSRLKALTRNLFTTCALPASRAKPGHPVVAKAFREGTLEIHRLRFPGRVSTYATSQGDWRVELSRGAERL